MVLQCVVGKYMKKKWIIVILLLVVLLTGCTSNEDKITLKLQRFDFNLDNENSEYENSMVIKSENVSISGISFINIDKGKLLNYQDYIKKKYPNFDTSKWSIMVNMFSVNDGNGIIKFNYQIKDVIDTNKSILMNINNNVITKISFINMDFVADEEELIELINDFKNKTIQEKKKFNENEEFLKEDITYTYHYNTDELIYTYQLYFYQQHGEDKVINNEYGTEYLINQKKLSET